MDNDVQNEKKSIMEKKEVVYTIGENFKSSMHYLLDRIFSILNSRDSDGDFTPFEWKDDFMKFYKIFTMSTTQDGTKDKDSIKKCLDSFKWMFRETLIKNYTQNLLNPPIILNQETGEKDLKTNVKFLYENDIVIKPSIEGEQGQDNSRVIKLEISRILKDIKEYDSSIVSKDEKGEVILDENGNPKKNRPYVLDILRIVSSIYFIASFCTTDDDDLLIFKRNANSLLNLIREKEKNNSSPINDILSKVPQGVKKSMGAFAERYISRFSNDTGLTQEELGFDLTAFTKILTDENPEKGIEEVKGIFENLDSDKIGKIMGKFDDIASLGDNKKGSKKSKSKKTYSKKDKPSEIARYVEEDGDFSEITTEVPSQESTKKKTHKKKSSHGKMSNDELTLSLKTEGEEDY